MKSNLKCNVRAREFRCNLTRVCFWIRLRPTILLRLHCLRSLKVMMMSQSTILISLKSNPKMTMTMIPICQHLRETLRLSLLMQLFSTTHKLLRRKIDRKHSVSVWPWIERVTNSGKIFSQSSLMKRSGSLQRKNPSLTKLQSFSIGTIPFCARHLSILKVSIST